LKCAGHCCDLSDAANFVAGAYNAYASDNALGAGRTDQATASGKLGAAFGDSTGGNIGGLAFDATVVGAPAGIAVNVAATVVTAHGIATAVEGVTHLAASALGTKPVHGNTAGNQPAELYEKTDKDGNLEKHGVSQDASKRYSKAEVGEGKVTVTDRGPRKEMLAKETKGRN
jgi:hypothetical protein